MKAKAGKGVITVAGWALLAGLASPAVRAQGPEVQSDSAEAWHLTVTPMAGLTGFRGNGAIGPLSGGLKMPFHKVARDTRFAMAGSVAASRGPLTLWLDGQYLDMSQNVSFDGGVNARAKAYATQLNLGASWRVWAQNLGGKTFTGGPQQVTLAPLAGVRWTRLSAKLDADGMQASQHDRWAIPFAGLRSGVDLGERWLLTGEADAGAWGQDFTAQGQVMAGYRLTVFGQPAVAQAGYRVLHLDHKASDFHWNVTQYGPAAGLSVIF